MKNKLLILVLLNLFSIVGFAQKIDREKLGKYQTIVPPETPLPLDYNSYTVKVDAPDMYIRDMIVSSVNIDGFRQVLYETNQPADIKINIEVYPFTTTKAEPVASTTTRKVDGIEKKTTTHGIKAAMHYKFRVLVYDRKDSLLLVDELTGNEDVSTSGYPNPSAAYEAYEGKQSRAPKKIVEDRFPPYSRKLTNKFGYVETAYWPHAYSVKVGRKCPYDYSDLISAYEKLESAVEVVKENNEATDEFMVIVAPALDIWNTALKETNMSDSKARINKDHASAIYYNMGTCYFYAKEYDKSAEYYKKSVDIKSLSDADKLQKQSEDLYRRNTAVEALKKQVQ